MLSDYSLDLNSETMISFLEMENVQEVETVEKKPVFKEQVTRPSVFMKTDGTPTVVDEEVIDTNITMEELNNAV